MTRTEALAALTKLAQQSSGEPTLDEHDGPTCRRCERDFSMDDECDDDGLCHACAHAICLELPAIAAALAAPPVLEGVESRVHVMTTAEFDSPENANFKSWVQTNLENDERRLHAAIASAARLEGDRAGRLAVLEELERAAGGVVGRAGLLDYVRELRSKLTDTGGSDA